MALSGILRYKLAGLIASPCSKQVILKTSLPALTSAVENYESRKGINYMQYRERKRWQIFPDLKPINFNSGDPDYEEPPHDEILYKYKHLTQIEQYPPDLKKLFTVEYATMREKLEHQHMTIQEKVHERTGNEFNMEKLIAYLTIKIRHLQVDCDRKRWNKRMKHYTFQRIAKRYKFLNYLRRQHKDNFHWLIQELNINYKLPNEQRTKKLTRKEKRFQEAIDEMNREKAKKENAIQMMFKEEKKKLMEHKEEVLKDITVDALKYGIDVKEVMTMFKEEQERKKKLAKAKPVKMGINFVKFYEQEQKRKERQTKIIPDPYVLGLKK